MGAKELILKRIAENRANKIYDPEFKAGDIILNTKYKIVRKVLEVKVYDINEQRVPDYIMKNISNELTSKRNLAYKVTRECMRIDAFYEKIDVKTAQILYGALDE